MFSAICWCNLVLNTEQVSASAIEAVTPELRVLLHIAELGLHTQQIATLLDLPSEQRLHFQLPSRPRRVDIAALVAKRGAPRHHTKMWDLRQTDHGDVYLLSHIIHDWTEAQCVTILRTCRAAMKPGSRLLIIEMVLPVGNTPHPVVSERIQTLPRTRARCSIWPCW
jgi:hypothetical protein